MLEEYHNELEEICQGLNEDSDLLKIIGDYPEIVDKAGGNLAVVIYLFKYVENS